MRERTKKRCLCGRSSAPTRRLVVPSVREGGLTAVTGPFCPGPETAWPRCPQLTAEEHADPEMRRFHTNLSPVDYDVVDPGIWPFVEICLMRELGSMSSCDGHNEREAYIQFWDDAGADEAWRIFGNAPCFKGEMRSKLYGRIPTLFFPVGVVEGSVRRTMTEILAARKP